MLLEVYENARKIPIDVLIELWKLVGLLKTKKKEQEQEQTNKNKAQYVSLFSMLPIPPDITWHIN